jgi:hypothetical protein
VVSFPKVGKEPGKGALCRRLGLIGEFNAFGFSAAAKKDLRTAHDKAKDVLDLETSDITMGFDRLAGFNCLRRRGGAVNFERLFSRNLGRNRVAQILVLRTRKKTKEQRTVCAGSAGIAEDSFVILTPSIAEPKRDFVQRRGWPTGGEFHIQLTRLMRVALLQDNRP